MSDAAIDVVGVVKSYDDGRIRALRGMDLRVEEREWVALMGPSGCGKSTLLHLIAALDRPDAGRLRVCGTALDQTGDAADYRRTVTGLVFQLHNLLPALSAPENVEVPMFGTGQGRRARRERALRLLDRVGLADRARARPTQLSGGERQRVAIARALADDPRVLLADEPAGSLDSASGRRILDLIAEVRTERGLTVLMVTHDLDIAHRADRIVRMLDGRNAAPAERPASSGPEEEAVGQASGA